MKVVKADITKVQKGIIVHSVNCQGAMGSGVAGAIRRKWPQVFSSYKSFCDRHNNSHDLLGKVDIVKIDDGLYVANVFGQEFYGNDGKTYANPISLLQGVTSVFLFAEQYDLPIHSVKVGSGLGGLSWDKDVQPIFSQLEDRHIMIPLTVYEL